MISVFGYELIREILVPDLLGKEAPDILYWAGKNLARKFPLLSHDELYAFFVEAGWGYLHITKEGKLETEYELTSSIIKNRLKSNPDSCFRMETGFLAQQIQSQKKVITEAYEEIHKKQQSVKIIVKWDKKDPVHD
ncbi:DUF2507 domain-containing protein [Falsibacillus albus]|uniref:DUF2507 domain-containing protein n=2 Tax=Falsibacillus albus TaxID=2478915 RepID=A0A3L7K5L5_9BACI|nr:DUF2507 domain-containing protein [Falsibacillus albus]